MCSHLWHNLHFGDPQYNNCYVADLPTCGPPTWQGLYSHNYFRLHVKEPEHRKGYVANSLACGPELCMHYVAIFGYVCISGAPNMVGVVSSFLFVSRKPLVPWNTHLL